MCDVSSIGGFWSTCVWKPVKEAAKKVAAFAVGAEDSPDLPPVASVVIVARCSGDLEQTNQVKQLREDGITMLWPTDAMEDGTIKDDAWKFEKAKMKVEGTGERYQEEQLEAASGILTGEGWNQINTLEILVYLNPYLISQDITDAQVCESGMYNISLINVAEAAKLDHTRLPVSLIGYTIKDEISKEEINVVLDEPKALEAFCTDPKTVELRLLVPENFYPQDASDDPHENSVNLTLSLDLLIDNTNVNNPNDNYLSYIMAELEAD